MDWQTILVILIVLAAAFFVGRRIWQRLHSFSRATANSCETGCGKCGTTTQKSSLVLFKQR
jgi:hypothetical protein